MSLLSTNDILKYVMDGHNLEGKKGIAALGITVCKSWSWSIQFNFIQYHMKIGTPYFRDPRSYNNSFWDPFYLDGARVRAKARAKIHDGVPKKLWTPVL